MILAVLVLRQQLAAERLVEPFLVDFLDSLHDLKQSGASGNAIGFQRGCDRKTDRFLGSGFVCDYEICCQSTDQDDMIVRIELHGLVSLVIRVQPVCLVFLDVCFVADHERSDITGAQFTAAGI